MLEHGAQVFAERGFVVFAVAGGEDSHLAGGAVGRGRLGRGLVTAAVALAQRVAMVPRQACVGVNTERGLQQRTRVLVLVDGIDHVDDDRDAGELADAVGRGNHLVAEFGAPVLEAERLGAQHQVGEIHVPLVWRHVRALRQVAQVAQVAVVDDLPVVLAFDAVDFHRVRLVDEIEKRRE